MLVRTTAEAAYGAPALSSRPTVLDVHEGQSVDTTPDRGFYALPSRAAVLAAQHQRTPLTVQQTAARPAVCGVGEAAAEEVVRDDAARAPAQAPVICGHQRAAVAGHPRAPRTAGGLFAQYDCECRDDRWNRTRDVACVVGIVAVLREKAATGLKHERRMPVCGGGGDGQHRGQDGNERAGPHGQRTRRVRGPSRVASHAARLHASTGRVHATRRGTTPARPPP